MGRVPKPPADSTARLAIDRALREFVGLTHPIGPLLPSKPIDAVPRSLICILHESYLGQLSETFSKSSHEGKFEDADEAGLTILALYTIIYPPNYPQIGELGVSISPSFTDHPSSKECISLKWQRQRGMRLFPKE